MTDINRLKTLSGIVNESTLDEVSPEGYNDTASSEYGVINRQIEILNNALADIAATKWQEPFQKYAQPAEDELRAVIANLEARSEKRGKGIGVARQKMKDKGHDMTGYTARKNPPGSPGWKKGAEPAGGR